jgi:hypothetical protein
MRGVPDHSQEPPSLPTSVAVTVSLPTFVPKEPISDGLAALGREVLDMVPRTQRGSLAAYRKAASDLSAILARDRGAAETQDSVLRRLADQVAGGHHDRLTGPSMITRASRRPIQEKMGYLSPSAHQ